MVVIIEKRGSENAVQQPPRILNPKELDSLKKKLEELLDKTFSYKGTLDEKVLEYRKQFMTHPEVIEGADNCKEKLAKFENVVEQTFKFMDDIVLVMRNMLDIIKQQAKINMQEAKINMQGAKINQQEMVVSQQEAKINKQGMIVSQQEAKINKQEAKINMQKVIVNQKEAIINQQEAKIIKQEVMVNQQEAILKQQEEIINQQEAKISQLEAYVEDLKNSHTRVNIYRTYRDWVGKFRRMLVVKVNEKVDEKPYKKSRKVNDWFALERKIYKERSERYTKKVMTKHLESVLRDFGMSMRDSDLLSDLKAVSNFTFHNNDQTIKDAKNYLNKIVFPEDMALLKNPLQKALDAIENWKKDDVYDDDDDDDDDEQ